MTKVIKRVASATCAAAAFGVLAGIVANNFQGSHADGSMDIITLAETGSLTITASSDTTCANYDDVNGELSILVRPGAIAADCITINAETDSAWGYTLTIDGPDTGNLAHEGNSSFINATTGTMTAPSTFGAQTTAGAWGFGIPLGQIQGNTELGLGFDASYTVLEANNTTNTARYAAVPTSPAIFSVTSEASSDDYNIFFAMSLGGLIPTGAYSGQVVISGLMNVAVPPEPTVSAIAPNNGTVLGGTAVTITGDNFMMDSGSLVVSVMIGTFPCDSINVSSNTTLTCTTSAGSVGAQDVIVNTMGGTATLTGGFTYNAAGVATGDNIQTVTAANCPTTRTRVVDARDNSSYWIRKVGDLCWMETNLAYKGGGTNTYGDTMTITAGTSSAGTVNANSTGSSAVCYGSNASMNTNGQGCFWEPTGSNITAGATDPSTSTSGTGQYGVLYNWCAAMGNQSAACQTGAATQPNQSVNGGTGAGATGTTIYNVCPSGRRLPTGEATTGEFTLLNNTLNSGSTSSPTGLFTNGLYMYAGYFANGSFIYQGSDGGYWSSTVVSAASAFRLAFFSSNVYPANSSNKGYGLSVRCVAP